MPTRRTSPPSILKSPPQTPYASGQRTPPALAPAFDVYTPPTPPDAPLPFSGGSSFHGTHVRFPPTPKLATRRITYPSGAYDRTPIEVAKNACALPRRNARCKFQEPEPVPEPEPQTPRRRRGSPLAETGAAASSSAGAGPSAPLPALSWSSSSSSSESDDSDPGARTPPQAIGCPGTDALGLAFAGMALSNGALAFLPHAPAASPEPKRRRSATPAARVRRPMPAPAPPPSNPWDDGCLGGF
jgi:hypothetical protein